MLGYFVWVTKVKTIWLCSEFHVQLYIHIFIHVQLYVQQPLMASQWAQPAVLVCAALHAGVGCLCMLSASVLRQFLQFIQGVLHDSPLLPATSSLATLAWG
jgi:hypothetical protein